MSILLAHIFVAACLILIVALIIVGIVISIVKHDNIFEEMPFAAKLISIVVLALGFYGTFMVGKESKQYRTPIDVNYALTCKDSVYLTQKNTTNGPTIYEYCVDGVEYTLVKSGDIYVNVKFNLKSTEPYLHVTLKKYHREKYYDFYINSTDQIKLEDCIANV